MAASLPSRSPQNFEYLSFSLASSLTTSNRLPALLMAWTAPESPSSKTESNHLIMGVLRGCRWKSTPDCYATRRNVSDAKTEASSGFSEQRLGTHHPPTSQFSSPIPPSSSKAPTSPLPHPLYTNVDNPTILVPTTPLPPLGLSRKTRYLLLNSHRQHGTRMHDRRAADKETDGRRAEGEDSIDVS